MQLFVNRSRWAACQNTQLPVEQLSDEQLLVRRTKNRQMIGVVVMLMVLVMLMSFLSEQFFLAGTTAGMVPALDEYVKKRRAIRKEVQKRNLR